ncbi:SDR family NAD(P)-dependent oxidoreductase [Rhodococcus opacus]|nr:SDR family NAD(P)-dependent oxidoreductase [Rhodococcus opacus]
MRRHERSRSGTLVQACINRFGTVDVLVNNADVTRDGYLAKLAESDFDLVIGVSLKDAWLGTRAVEPHFRAQRSGAIINMPSLSGKIGNPGQSTYSSAKAGLIGLTKSSAKELDPSAVHVNAIQPGLVRTAMTLAMKSEIFAAKEAEGPLGRQCHIHTVTPRSAPLSDEPPNWPEWDTGGGPDAAVFLTSPMASYINGAVLEVTGGRGM